MTSPTDSNNNSDYDTPSTDLFGLLPAPYQSNTNRSVFSNLFNRFLSKNQTQQVIGYIGFGNPAAVVVRQIKEPTVGRQAYQLQPLLYDKIGTIEYITSWQDIEDELTAQGIDIDDQPIWNNATIFNFAPPIDINKFINYEDYYWYDPQNPSSQAQYITVKPVASGTTSGWDTAPWDSGPWDDISGISGATIQGLYQWMNQNKWLHKTVVPNFTIAKRAQAPIIEYEPNLELNEWIQTTYSWSYRANSAAAFAPTTAQPTRFELEPINVYTSNTNTIFVDERYGDLTNIFVPGFKFIIQKIAAVQTVVSSSYQLNGESYQTQIVVASTLPILNPTVNYLQPELTSQGDQFVAYGINWLFDGINETTAINHQPDNPMLTPSVMTYTGTGYTYQLSPYSEVITTQISGLTTFTLSTDTPSGSTRSLQQRALVGYNDVRVYLNGTRQYGTYDEVGTTYVTGITFLSPLPAQSIVTIAVGESAISDFGNYAVPVRTYASDTDYATYGNTLVSLIGLRKNEQIKTAVNQYPLFDIYYTNSQSADIANNIFGYHEGSTGTLYPFLGRRVITAEDGSLDFQNNLVQTNDGVMYAYRNYNKSANQYWYNPTTNILYVWTGFTWSAKYTINGAYETPLVTNVLPDPTTTVIGTLVYLTTNNTLYQRVNTSANWATLPVYISNSDQTLETVWRHGLNNEQFVPAQVDWLQRSYPEYQAAYNTYIAATVASLQQSNPTLSTADATTEANTSWTTMQNNNIVQAWYSDPMAVREGPLWVGEWQVPDTLYYNVSHECRLYVSYTQLYTHFESIIAAQPPYNGFMGQPSANWNLIPYTLINWGLGGTIHEYDNSFDTFLSAEFIDIVTPPSLFSFAQSEYENILVTLGQTFQRNAVAYLTTTDTASIQNPGTVIANAVILAYEENEAANLVYGDSTTYQQATATTPASGIQNFIATLPYFGIFPKTAPYANIDSKRGINDIVAHDGHRESFTISQITINSLQSQIVATTDPRFPTEKFGCTSTNLPPATQASFISTFSPNMRNGVYWLDSTTNKLYRLTAYVGTVAPATTNPQGSLWWNTTGSGVLNILQGSNWVPVNPAAAPGAIVVVDPFGITRSVWSVVNLNQIYLDIVLDAETLLFEQAPPPPLKPPVDFAAIEAQDPTQWNQLLQQQFNNYVRAAQITTPFANNTYDPSNPFTWNYKYSIAQNPARSGTLESGGDWRDLYQKTYGTPYPHLEPWLVQGYPGKPSWWDGLFANNNPDLYGKRRWKYMHALPIVNVNSFQFFIGPYGVDQSQVFRDFNTFTVHTESNSNGTQFTVDSVTFAGGYTVVSADTITGIPWLELNPTLGPATISVGMWDYVIRGATPPGFQPPPTTPYAYSYVSVNIAHDPQNPATYTFTDGTLTYGPDDVFPPYWNFLAHIPPLAPTTQYQDTYVRSIFYDMALEVISENADYVWLDSGPIEWLWQNSTEYLYSLLTVAYLMQPVRTIQQTFGIVFDYIDGLPIDSLTGKVFAHGDTQFHGEITTSNQLVKVNGINQWYINYLRANGFDTSYSDFRAMWTAWTAPLAYQFGATIDTSTFSIDHRTVEITSADYELTMKRSPGVSNSWIDAFNVLITGVPPIQALYPTESYWQFTVDTLAPVSRTVDYYAVRQYDYYIDPATSICSLFTYPIVETSVIESSFVIDGDVSDIFGGLNGATQFAVTGSTYNNGTYTVVSSTYNATANQTTLVVSNPVASLKIDGLIAPLNYRTLPWTTGQLVSISTTEIAPQPLDTALQYFAIVLSATTFQLAYTAADATLGIPILFTTPAYGIQRVGELYNKFVALDGAVTSVYWNHYVIDDTIVKQFAAPYNLTGMQNLVNIIDGYNSYSTNHLGYGINVDGSYRDPQTGQLVSWQNEIERFINWAYTQQTVRKQRQNDKYAVDIDYTTGQFIFTSQFPNFITGTPVVMWAFGGGLPYPAIRGQVYYLINNGTYVQLAYTRTEAQNGIAISFGPTGSTGQLYLSAAALYLAELPTYEINPFRNALWYSPSEGVVTNLVTGPYVDINSSQLLFDQYGRKLAPGDIRVFRQDKITQIQFAGGVYNDTNIIQQTQQNPYLFLHLGGGNIYVDTYEHVIIFNDYTSAGAFIYDPFVGLNTTKWELDFYKSTPFTERPNMGGYFLSTNYNQGGNLDRNIEASINDIRYMYDLYQIPDTLPAAQRARALLDYPGSISYLQYINLPPKSQFLFWLGSLHAKGSVNAVNAFVRSRRFVSANVDQFWAYQVAQFGSAAEQEYLSLLLFSTDTITNDLHLEFVRSDEVCLPGYAVNTFGNEDCGYANPQGGSLVTYNVDPTFIPIAITDTTRWYNQPDQLDTLIPDGGQLYFALKPQQKLTVYPTTIGTNSFNPYAPDNITDPTSPLYFANLTTEVAVIAFDPANNLLEASQQHPYTFWYWNTDNNGYWEYGGGWDGTTTAPILRHNFKADEVQMNINWYGDGYENNYVIPASPADVKELTISPYLPLTNSLQVFENGVQLVSGTDYVESLETPTGSTILGYKIYFANSISGSTINVVYGPSLLNSELQYNTINTNILQLGIPPAYNGQEIVTHMFTNNIPLVMWGLETDKETQNPAKIIDEQAEVVLSPVTYWDPARGYQYYLALHSIDIQSNDDPAIYSTSNGWTNQEVGKTWMDTTNVQYLPYYDPNVITDQLTRLGDWGQLTDYGQIRIFQWVKSPVAPTDYNALAAAQENDSSIDESVRLSGTVRQDVRYRNRANTTITLVNASQGNAVVNFSGTVVSTDYITLASGPSTYAFTIQVDGGLTRTISYPSTQFSNVTTFAQLIQLLSTQITSYNATIALSGNQIVITSNTVGTPSAITITDDNLFSSLSSSSSSSVYQNIVSTPGVNQQLVAASVTAFAVGDTVLFSSTGTLPTGLTASTQYTISSISGNVVAIADTTITSEGTGVLTMSDATTNNILTGGWPNTWTLAAQVQADIDPLIDAVSSSANGDVVTYTFNLINCVDPTESYAIPLFSENDTVNIYVNGVFNQTLTLTGAGPWPLALALNTYDRVTVIRPIHVPTSTELAFDPTVADDGTTQIQYQYITNYNAVQTVDLTTNQNIFTYYFWVENVTTSTSDRESPVNAIADLTVPPIPYMFFNKLVSSQVVINADNVSVTLPDRFVQAIIHGLRGYVDSNNRYVLRFTRDFTLRDNLKFGTSPLQLKDTHQEWFMFRQDQLDNVPRDLWDKITESIIGFAITTSTTITTTRVPSLDREMYDTTYGTSTQYGLGDDQAFVNGTLALATVQSYLNDPTNNFYPIDLDTFFASYNFDTAQNIVNAMNEIYTTFSYTNVNNIYFSVLQDALTTQTQYAGLMKTSALALYGVELLDVNGVFDD